MFSASGYSIREQIHDSTQSLIFRAAREADGLPVILKVLKDVQPTPARIARFKREYQIVKELDLPGVVKGLDFARGANHWLFIQEDFGGESLARLDLAGRVEIGELLSIAEALAGHVAAIHQRSVIHKDLNPSNIVLERRSGVVKLIDFGISTRLSREAVAFDHPSLIEGTPAYLAPEQTGRINQPLDQRADLYALGCTLYELLTGRPPFESTDLVELLHCHLARAPEPLRARRADAPPALGAIVERLMAKNAADRYQSARGLQFDLARCRDDFRAHGADTFTPGTRDVAQRLLPPTRLYGRDAEAADLVSTFERVAAGGHELIMISGDPGVGKSALVKELYRPVTERRGFFVAGKFDQLQRDRPYGPILDALDDLIGQVLMAPPAQVAEWAATQRAAAGRMLPSLMEVLPRLELLHGRLAPAAALSPAEVARRFIGALAGLIGVFARADHPVVLFIDDLQWADNVSLDLLKHLTTAAPIAHLFVLGAYRHHEVPAAHPLRATLKDIRAAGVEVRELHLEPLDVEDTTAFLADALHRHAEEVREPAGVVHQKTAGNPLFIQTFLDTLVTGDVVFFDQEAGAWQWRTERLRLLELSDNVVDLLIASLQRLSSRTREMLAQAACLGNHFELGLLAATTGIPASEVAAALMPAVAANYLIPTNGDYRLLEAGIDDLGAALGVAYKFAHDRIQQAAYGLSAPGAHHAIHLRVGRAMRAHYTGKSAESHLLATVNQLNQASDLLDEDGERREVAQLNLEAGKKARAAVANAAALDYFERGIALLGSSASGGAAPEGDSGAVYERAFRAHYPLALALTEGAAEAAYVKADFPTMDRHVDALLRHAERQLDRITASQVRINAQIARFQLAETIVCAREVLAPLGIELPLAPTEADIAAQFQTVTRELGGRSPLDLVDLPDGKEAEPAGILHILHSIAMSAFLTQPPLLPVVVAQMVLLTLRHGLVEDSVGGFIYYGMTLCAREHFDLGYDFGRLAEILVEKRQFLSQAQDLAALGGGYLFHWKRPVRDSIQKMRDAYGASLENGNIGPGTLCLQGSSAARFWAGHDLREIDEEYLESAQALKRHKQGVFLTWLHQYHQAVRNFRGLNADPTLLQGDVYDEVAEMPVHESVYDMTAIYNVHFNRSMLCYHFHDYPGSLRFARMAERGNQPGAIVLPIATLYHCLSLLATHESATLDQRPAILEEAAALVSRMKRWGEACPVNYAHKHHLMAAELARVTGRPSEARDQYDLAIDLAHEHGYLQEEGLAQERAALFFLEQGNARLAGDYMRHAYYTYDLWGATAKRDFLRRRYGHLLERETTSRARAAQSRSDSTTVTTTTRALGDLDLATVLAATRAITRETDAARLLETVMRVSLENAGAERGFLVLVRDEQLIVKVRGEMGEDPRFESVSLALHDEKSIARSVVQYVARTAEPVLLGNAAEEGMFTNDPHVRVSACKSLLCLPILYQGTLVAISYLENNQATSVFNEDRLDVLTLLMGQAAVSIENALLKAAGEVRDFTFSVGGSLPADAPTYVRRQADELLAGHVRGGELCYVFNTRQMGKSSLRVRAVDRLGKAGVACASIDLTSIGARDVTAEQWYAGVARALVVGLGLHKDLDLRPWWRDRADLSPVQRLDVLFDEVILERIKDPVAVFIDEVDAVLGLPFSPDDFFALIRSLYNRRADDARYQRLAFVLLGVATPADLIRDKRRTPFNVGRAVPLGGFRFDEARNLVPGLARAGDGEQLLRAVLDWSGGQPFLTQKLCRLVVDAETRPLPGREREWVANLVEQRVIDRWRHRDEPEHLRTIEARVLHAPLDEPASLSLYQRILEAGEIDAGDSPEETALILSGLVTRTFDKLRVGNPIYARVFDEAWVKSAMDRRHASGSPEHG
jgi:predicted ATPase/GAF domain-containing protein